ncbi:MAG: hypothetical protein K1X92_13985 [Bacteroidia bacterium]|nr:hypothetical protein [Bacteroidia bacterium]
MKESVTSFLNSLHAAGIRPEARSANYPNSYELNAEGALIGLNLSGLNLQRLHLPLAGLEELQKLDLSKNAFTSLSFEGGLPALTFLDISYNGGELNLLEFPAGFERLKYLYLYQSKLKSIDFTDEMPVLEILHLADNALIDFSVNPDFFPNLVTLYLYKNPNIGSIPKEIIDKERENAWEGVKSVLAALRTGWMINCEAKVIFMGNGISGKTTLSEQLRHKDHTFIPIPPDKRTHGILTDAWEIPLSSLSDDHPLKKKIKDSISNALKNDSKNNKKPSMPKTIRLNLWDFGGQEYYHATHRLFLNSNALYLLVWETATDCYLEYLDNENRAQEHHPKGYWVNNIETYSDKLNTTLYVHNKIREGEDYHSSQSEFKIDFYNPDNTESVKENLKDIKKLKEAILKNCTTLQNMGKPFPEVYDDIRGQLRKHPKYMSYSDYETLCFEMGKARGEIMNQSGQIKTVTELLDQTGSIICYRFRKDCPDSLKDYVFTEPEWITDGIYRILSPDLINKGTFDIDHIYQKAPELPPEVWIDLLKQFELIFKDTAKGCIVAPQYLPKNCPNVSSFQWATDDRNMQTAFVLSFPEFMPKSLFLRLIAEYGTLHVKNLYWKNGLVFTLNHKTIFADCDFENRKIEIQIQDKDENIAGELFRWFSDKIHPHTRIHSGKEEISWADLQKDPRYHGEIIRNAFCFAFGEGIENGIEKEQSNYDKEVKTELENEGQQPEFRQYKILMLTANPAGTTRINLDKEQVAILDKIEKNQDKFPFRKHKAVDKTSFKEETETYCPNILHFSGHGEKTDEELAKLGLINGGLIVQNENHNGYETITANQLDLLFEYFKDKGLRIHAVILNSCYSESQAKEIAKHVDYVIGTSTKIKNSHAIAFSVGFYFALSHAYPNLDIQGAYKSGRAQACVSGADKGDFLLYHKGNFFNYLDI